MLVCCTCHFQSGSSSFILASSVCRSLQCVISALTQGSKVAPYLGSLVQLSCGEGGTLQTNTAGMCGECSQWVDHIGFATAQGSMYFPDLHCSGSQVALQGHCPKWALCLMQFPGLSRSGFWVFCRGTDPDGLCILCPSQFQAAQVTWCLVSTLSQVGCVSYSPARSQPSFPGVL